MVRINLFKDIRIITDFLCPTCGDRLDVVGLSDTILWCRRCKQGYYLELRKTKVKEADLKDVAGFSKYEEVKYG